MSLREGVARQRLIIYKLRNVRASFKDIMDHLERESELQGYNFNVSFRTFQRDMNDIRFLYNIDIRYNRAEDIYFIDDSNSSPITDRTLEAFDILNAFRVADELRGDVYFETRKPQGTENLYLLLHAIKNKLRIKFCYQKFWEDIITQRAVDPYALKEFKNRWYLMAKDNKDGKVKSFGLDRLNDLEITNIRFTIPTGLNTEEKFRYCFGIISAEGKEPEDIILSFDPVQGKYIKSLPLHHEQKVLIDNHEELQIQLRLCITHDLLMELLSYGDSMKVLQPQSLVQLVKEAHQKAIELYQV